MITSKQRLILHKMGRYAASIMILIQEFNLDDNFEEEFLDYVVGDIEKLVELKNQGYETVSD